MQSFCFFELKGKILSQEQIFMYILQNQNIVDDKLKNNLKIITFSIVCVTYEAIYFTLDVSIF